MGIHSAIKIEAGRVVIQVKLATSANLTKKILFCFILF